MNVLVRISAWTAVTLIGFAFATTVGTLAAAPLGSLHAILGGMFFLIAYGAVLGAVLGLVQLTVIRRRAVWSSWIVASVLGFAVGLPVMALVGDALGKAVDPLVNLYVGEGTIQDLSGATLGLIVGVAQWLALREGLPRRRGWLIGSAVGTAIGYGIAAALLEGFEIDLLRASLVLWFGATVGLFMGLAQGIVLARVGARS